ncbi:hypothetical protein HDV05_008047, partial [Chytridiales sp. JEL 0842]
MRTFKQASDAGGSRRLRSLMREKNIPLDPSTAELYIYIQSKAGNLQSCIETLVEMKKQKIRISKGCWNSLLTCAVISSRSIEPIWSLMVERNVAPDLATVTILAQACFMDLNNAAKALRLAVCSMARVSRIKPFNIMAPDTKALNAIIADLPPTTDAPAFAASLLQLLLTNQKATPSPHIAPFSALINHYVDIAQPERALDIVTLMRQRHVKPDAGIY